MGYCKPFKRGESWRSQNFGDTVTVYGPHTGNDEAAPIGTKVHAAGDGVIEHAGEFDSTYADNLLWLIDYGGKCLVLNCGDNEPSFVYAHLSLFHVKPGDRVKKGQIIAESGNTGKATTGAHLHQEAIPPGYSLRGVMLGRVDPDIYLTEWPEDLIKVASVEPVKTTPVKPEKNKMLIISQQKGDTAIWIGDGITRRQIPDVPTLESYRSLARAGVMNIYQNGATQNYPLSVLGVAVK